MLLPLTLIAILAQQPAGTPTQSAKPAAAPASGASLHYLEVPLRGEFGKEITAPGVRDALRQAKARKADHVVFVFDSLGGRVADADAITRVMEQERGNLTYDAVITRAISASVWPLSHCDHVFFAPGAAAGAAVAFTRDASTGQYEVDAKFNAAKAAEVSAAADKHGQPGCVYRAMMIQDARLFRWRGPDGKYKLASEPPEGNPSGVEELDTAQTVLAWTTQQASESGFGAVLASADLSALGPLLGASEWSPAGDSAGQIMVRAAKEVERRAAEVEKIDGRIKEAYNAVDQAAKKIAAQLKIARGADPANIQVYTTNTGLFTADSAVRWREASDKAVSEWNAVVDFVNDFTKAQREAEARVGDLNKAFARECEARLYDGKPEPVKPPEIDVRVDLAKIRKEAADNIQRIGSQRLKNHL